MLHQTILRLSYAPSNHTDIISRQYVLGDVSKLAIISGSVVPCLWALCNQCSVLGSRQPPCGILGFLQQITKLYSWYEKISVTWWYLQIFCLCGHLQAFRKFLPLFDRVLVERFTAETVTKGGIMLPEKSQGKVLQATVVAVGPGSVNQVTVYCCLSNPNRTNLQFSGEKTWASGKASLKNVFYCCKLALRSRVILHLFFRQGNYKQSAWRLARKYYYQSTVELKSFWTTRCSRVWFVANWADLFPLLSSIVTFYCFSYLTSRTISCSVMEISSVNTLNESSCFVAVEHVQSQFIPGEKKKLNGLFHVCFPFFLCYFICK